MNINDYIACLEAIINSSPIVSSYNLHIDRKTSDIAFISGTIDFRDSSTLDFKEFVESAGDAIEKYKYAYNYRKGENNVFRYDNAPDPRAKGLKSFPHHKHIEDRRIVETEAIELLDALHEIERTYPAEDKEA